MKQKKMLHTCRTKATTLSENKKTKVMRKRKKRQQNNENEMDTTM